VIAAPAAMLARTHKLSSDCVQQQQVVMRLFTYQQRVTHHDVILGRKKEGK